MTRLYRFDEIRRAPRPTFFDRHELSQLLSLYSRRVASAVFSVFRHTHDAPAFRIAKRPSRFGGGEYVVSSGAETLKQAATMSEALTVFSPSLRVVS